MGELLNVFKELFQIAPGPAALIFVGWLYFFKYKPSNTNGKYVLKEDCHGHIDELKREMINLKDDLKEHINGVDRKVDILIQKALK